MIKYVHDTPEMPSGTGEGGSLAFGDPQCDFVVHNKVLSVMHVSLDAINSLHVAHTTPAVHLSLTGKISTLTTYYPHYMHNPTPAGKMKTERERVTRSFEHISVVVLAKSSGQKQTILQPFGSALFL